jgi:hypothetical protein
MFIEYLSKDELAVYSAALTEACRAIFGDIVVKATFTEEFYRKENKYCSEQAPSIRLKNNYLDWSQEDFSVEFVSGAIVQFTNSEWASLERLDNNADLQQV